MKIFSAKYYFAKFNSNINITAYIKLYTYNLLHLQIRRKHIYFLTIKSNKDNVYKYVLIYAMSHY